MYVKLHSYIRRTKAAELKSRSPATWTQSKEAQT